MKYSAPLDGLRAVAILAVLAFHALPGTLQGGFTGVDVFFVLSGYLIASVILHDIRDGRFSLREFYLRRIQRLLPNAVLMILVTVTLSYFALLPLATVKVAEHGVWSLLNLSNLYIWRNVGGYWGDSAASVPLLHTWSLAIEEQFYVLFPITLWVLSRRPRLCSIMSFLALGGFALGAYLTRSHPIAAFYLLPTRAWELLSGAALGAYRVPAVADRALRICKSARITAFAGWGGLALVVAGFFLINEGSNFPGIVALVPTIGTLAVLISIADGGPGPARFLSRPTMVLIGKLSYSIYLWHWPLIVLGKSYANLMGWSTQAGALIGALIGIALAAVAYQFIEQPLRLRGPGRRQRLITIAVGFSACATACVLMSMSHPIADPSGYFDRPVFSGQQYNVREVSAVDEAMSATKFADVVLPSAESHPHDVWNSGGIVHHWGSVNPRVVVIGSSHALMYAKLIDDICQRLGISVAFLSADGVSVFFTDGDDKRPSAVAFTTEFNAARKKWISQWKPDAVLMIDRWDNYDSAPQEFSRMLRELVGELSSHARHVICFSQVPVLPVGETINLREYVVWKMRSNGSIPRITEDIKEPFRRSALAIIDAVARDFPKLQLLRVDQPFYADDGTVRYASGRTFFYADDNHLSDAGAEQLREVCTRAIAAACDVPIGISLADHASN
ncbi:MAG TPA: acyltransferase family protein [Lacipirellulaceae bacterium]